MVMGMVVDYDPVDREHTVLVNAGQEDETCEPLPLVDYPDAYQVCGAGLRGWVWMGLDGEPQRGRESSLW